MDFTRPAIHLYQRCGVTCAKLDQRARAAGLCGMSCLLVGLWSTPCHAEDPTPPGEEEHVVTNAVVMNPVPIVVGLALDAAGMPSGVVSVRYHHAFTEVLSLSVVPVFSTTRAPFRTYLVAFKVGTRFSLSGRGLEGWYVSALGTFGGTWVNGATGDRLISAGVLGVGIEAGYTWNWSGFVFELAVGAHTEGFFGASVAASGLENARLRSLLPVTPVVNTSLGYAW